MPGGPKKCLLKCLDMVIFKLESNITKTPRNKSATKRAKRAFPPSMLADVTESIIGATAFTCGLDFSQLFLRSLNVLSENQKSISEKLDQLS